MIEENSTDSSQTEESEVNKEIKCKTIKDKFGGGKMAIGQSMDLVSHRPKAQ